MTFLHLYRFWVLLGIFYQLRGKRPAGGMPVTLNPHRVCTNTLTAVGLWRPEGIYGSCPAMLRISAIRIRAIILLESMEMLYLSTSHQLASSTSTSTASGGA